MRVVGEKVWVARSKRGELDDSITAWRGMFGCIMILYSPPSYMEAVRGGFGSDGNKMLSDISIPIERASVRVGQR